MSVHHHLAYETVGYAPVYVTLGSLVNSVKGGSYVNCHQISVFKSTQRLKFLLGEFDCTFFHPS